jgi:ubiquinone/menaquinone biosynthesis C-methylase UbiE
VALKLLNKKKGRYTNAMEALDHLVTDAPEPLGDIIRHRVSMWETWGNLTEVVRTGKVPPRRKSKKSERRFIKGIANIGATSAAEAAFILKRELKGAKRILDVGGGPAVYACEFARRNPGLKATVVDLPGPLEIARETVRAQGMGKRVRLKAGDALKLSSYGKGFDLVLLSNFLHCFKRPEAERVVTKAGKALKKGGTLAVKEFFSSRDGTAPYFSALFSINMLVVDAGDCFTRPEVEGWMERAGVTPVRFEKMAKYSAVLIGEKE